MGLTQANLRFVTPTAVVTGGRKTMSNPLTEDYFLWLVPQIRDTTDGSSNPHKTYDGLCRIMFEKEFVWTVPNDDNRIGDGLDLRVDFCRERQIPMETRHTLLEYCSFLEVLIGLSRRLSFNAGGEAPRWAWQLLTNLELTKMSDPLGRTRARTVPARSVSSDRARRRGWSGSSRCRSSGRSRPSHDTRSGCRWSSDRGS